MESLCKFPLRARAIAVGGAYIYSQVVTDYTYRQAVDIYYMCYK